LGVLFNPFSFVPSSLRG